MNQPVITAFISTFFALIAFAANSVLCRLALENNAIDAASFTSIRLFSGVVVLLALISISKRFASKKADSNAKQNTANSTGSWLAAMMLFIYALAFSYGYISLETGTGALVLFAAVQLTLIGSTIYTGRKLLIAEWLGLMLAFSGFIYLTLPKLTTPSFSGFVLMTIAGIAWGLYTRLGQGSKNPLADTYYNFLRTLPFTLLLMLIAIEFRQLTDEGILLAILSGAIASGIGYFIWYIALRFISSIQAAVYQLLVPIIAAIGGVIFAEETITQRLIESSLLIFSGILLVIWGKVLMININSASNK
ncbi:DMT family transporter [Thalassotalea sp. PLHSN55]|uniref:DMT family transporter n=1 Tax=Thalassotalea sp. PLHSN55 TaxID=3435888 RepID=UPI003F87B31B